MKGERFENRQVGGSNLRPFAIAGQERRERRQQHKKGSSRNLMASSRQQRHQKENLGLTPVNGNGWDSFIIYGPQTGNAGSLHHIHQHIVAQASSDSSLRKSYAEYGLSMWNESTATQPTWRYLPLYHLNERSLCFTLLVERIRGALCFR